MAVTEMDAGAFEQNVVREGKRVLAEFWAPWCGYCRRIAPALEEIARQAGEELMVGKVNVDQVPELAEREKIEVLPTLVLYQKGKAAASITAPGSKAEIEAFLRRNPAQ